MLIRVGNIAFNDMYKLQFVEQLRHKRSYVTRAFLCIR